MSQTTSLMGLFDESTETADAIDELINFGIPDEDIQVMTGLPYPEQALERHREWLRLPYIVLAGAVAGLIFGLFLSAVTPQLYPLVVGGRGLIAGPPAAIITFVFTMMATIVSTFLGVLWEMGFPSFEPKHYHREVTSGSLAVLLECPEDRQSQVTQIMESHGAHHIHHPERISL